MRVMITAETDTKPQTLRFHVCIVAVGYERRCRFVTEHFSIKADAQIGLEFGFLAEGSFHENKSYFERLGFQFGDGLKEDSAITLATILSSQPQDKTLRIFVDISAMSREMIANVILAVQAARNTRDIEITVAYAPSKFSGSYRPAPIRSASPIKRSLAGWSSQPEKPLGTIFGLGCEPGLALGALQFLEPDKGWIFQPKGVDSKYDAAMKKANAHIEDIFDVSMFNYEITKPTPARARLESLLSAVSDSFRLIVVPFGPKIFAWLALTTVVFGARSGVGVWAFSSKEQAVMVDRDAEGQVVWYSMVLSKLATLDHHQHA
jgi:hypothetical protein